MNKIRHVLCFLILVLCTSGALAAKKIATLYVPVGSSGYITSYRFHLSVLTPESVNYGVYDAVSNRPNDEPSLVSWTGGGVAPTLTMDGMSNLPDSSCPGIQAYDDRSPFSAWGCTEYIISVYYDGDLHGCPWIVSTYVESYSSIDANFNVGIYVGPTKVNSTCPGESLEPYDISWNENYVVHDKVLRLQSTGGIIEQTLPTFLMKNGRVCDGSQYDERGAYCRFVSQQITFSTSGCDNNKVTVTPEPHPVTDK